MMQSLTDQGSTPEKAAAIGQELTFRYETGELHSGSLESAGGTECTFRY